MGRLLHRNETERGATLVEFALILPILVMLMLGIFTGGNAYFEKITVTDAVREGTRFGATLADSSSWGATVQQRTSELSSNELSSEQICVQLIEVGTSPPIREHLGTECDTEVTPPATPTSAGTGDCIVKAWARKPARLEALLVSFDIDITARSVAIYERECP